MQARRHARYVTGLAAGPFRLLPTLQRWGLIGASVLAMALSHGCAIDVAPPASVNEPADPSLTDDDSLSPAPIMDPSAPAGSFRVRTEALQSLMDWHFTLTDVVPVDGEPISISWDFGDESSGEGADLAHSYAAPGLYEVVAQSRDSTGRARFISRTLVEAVGGEAPVGGTLSVTVQASTLEGPAPLAVSFTAVADGTSDAQFHWDFDNGRLALGAQVAQTFSLEGEYNVRVFASDAAGRSGSTAATISVAAASVGAAGGADSPPDYTEPPPPGSPESPPPTEPPPDGGSNPDGTGGGGGDDGGGVDPPPPPAPPALPPWPNSDLLLNSGDGFTFGVIAITTPENAWYLAPPLVYGIFAYAHYEPTWVFPEAVAGYAALQPNGLWGIQFTGAQTTEDDPLYPRHSVPWNSDFIDAILPQTYPGIPDEHFLNIFDATVRERASDYYVGQAVMHGAPMIFMDGLSVDDIGGEPAGTDGAAWRDACIDLIRLTTAKAHAVGKRTLVNAAGAPNVYLQSPILEYGDGFSIEMGMMPTWPHDYTGPETVTAELAAYRRALDAHKCVVLRPGQLGEARFHEFPLLAAGAMFVREPGDAIFIAADAEAMRPPRNPAWARWPGECGAALGGWQVVGDNVFTRAFANGTITVDYYTRNVTVTGSLSPPY